MQFVPDNSLLLDRLHTRVKVRAKERERERESEREKDRQTDRRTDRERQKNRERKTLKWLVGGRGRLCGRRHTDLKSVFMLTYFYFSVDLERKIFLVP